MKHILEVLDIADPSLPWTIVGKGPSFNLNKIDLNFPICAINNSLASAPCYADLTVCNDWRSLQNLSASKSNWIATPLFHHDSVPAHEYALDFFLSLAPALSRCGSSLAYFNHRGSSMRRSDGHGKIDCYISSVESAIEILALAGARHMRTIGIDGGSEYHFSFGKRNYPCALDGQFEQIEKLKKKYDLTIEKL